MAALAETRLETMKRDIEAHISANLMRRLKEKPMMNRIARANRHNRTAAEMSLVEATNTISLVSCLCVGAGVHGCQQVGSCGRGCVRVSMSKHQRHKSLL